MPTAPISVVIPAYNSGRFVVETIDSVLAQTVVPMQIIVIDDGSTDDTHERLQPYLPRIHYVAQSNQGVSAARNLGIARSTQQFLAFVDADDVWHPRKIEMQMRVFQHLPNLTLLGTDMIYWPVDRFPDCADMPLVSVDVITWSQLAVRNHFVTSSIILRREVLDQAGIFDTRLQGPEDRDLWLRVLEHSTGANLKLPLTGYRLVPGSVSQQVDRCRQGMRRMLAKLDERNAWQGRWRLRRKSYSYVDHACAYLYGATGQHGASLLCSLRSLALYPLPLGRDDVDIRFERLKRGAVNFLRLVHAKAPDGTYSDCLSSASIDLA